MPTAVNHSRAFASNSQLSQDSSQQSEAHSQHSRSNRSHNGSGTPGRTQSQAPSQSQTPSDKILFRLETEHPKVLIGMLMSFGSSSSASSSGSSSRNQRSQKASATQATITQSMLLNSSGTSGTTDLAASIGQMTIYSTETGLQLHQSSNLSSQSSMELPKELFSYYQTSANPSSSSSSVGGTSQSSQANNNNHSCCCISWKPLRNALILAMTQNPTKLSMTYNMNDEVLHVETECGGLLRRSNHNANQSMMSSTTPNVSAATGVVCTAVISGLVPPDEEPQLSQAFLQHAIVARILVPSSILMDVMELALVSPMAIQLQWKTTTLHTSTETKKSVLQVTAVGPCSECAVQWQIPIEWTTTLQNNNIDREDGDEEDTITAVGDDDTLTRASSTRDGSISRRNKRKSRNAKRTVRKVKHSYPYAAWAQAMKPLLDNQAHETCISVNEQGILAIQHQLLCHDNIAAFCDGLLVPLIVEDEDDDDGDSDDSEDDRTNASSVAARSRYTQDSSTGSSRDNRAEVHFTPPSQSTVGYNQTDQDDNDSRAKNSPTPIDLSQPGMSANDSQRNGNDDDDNSPPGDGAGGIEPSFFGALPVVDGGEASRRSSSRLSNASHASNSSKRREQRKRLRAQQRLSAGSAEGNEPSASSSSQKLSPVILPSSNSPPSHLGDGDHVEPTQTQDDDDDDDEEERYCSSPEVVYGKI